MASGCSDKNSFSKRLNPASRIDLRFDQEESRLDLIKDGDGLSAAPYLNTYHDLENEFSSFKMKTGEDVITFGTLPAKTTTPATFESANFYTDQRFDFDGYRFETSIS